MYRAQDENEAGLAQKLTRSSRQDGWTPEVGQTGQPMTVVKSEY
jgi:hypothetical protein